MKRLLLALTLSALLLGGCASASTRAANETYSGAFALWFYESFFLLLDADNAVGPPPPIPDPAWDRARLDFTLARQQDVNSRLRRATAPPPWQDKARSINAIIDRYTIELIGVRDELSRTDEPGLLLRRTETERQAFMQSVIECYANPDTCT